MNQLQIVHEVVRSHPDGIRTEWVKILSMQKGVSCADRFLRWLAKSGQIQSEKKEGDKTKTWYPVKFEGQQAVMF